MGLNITWTPDCGHQIYTRQAVPVGIVTLMMYVTSISRAASAKSVSSSLNVIFLIESQLLFAFSVKYLFLSFDLLHLLLLLLLLFFLFHPLPSCLFFHKLYFGCSSIGLYVITLQLTWAKWFGDKSVTTRNSRICCAVSMHWENFSCNMRKNRAASNWVSYPLLSVAPSTSIKSRSSTLGCVIAWVMWLRECLSLPLSHSSHFCLQHSGRNGSVSIEYHQKKLPGKLAGRPEIHGRRSRVSTRESGI